MSTEFKRKALNNKYDLKKDKTMVIPRFNFEGKLSEAPEDVIAYAAEKYPQFVGKKKEEKPNESSAGSKK